MAARKGNLEQAMNRLRLKKEELDLRIRKDEVAKKLATTKQQLKAIGGRIR